MLLGCKKRSGRTSKMLNAKEGNTKIGTYLRAIAKGRCQNNNTSRRHAFSVKWGTQRRERGEEVKARWRVLTTRIYQSEKKRAGVFGQEASGDRRIVNGWGNA